MLTIALFHVAPVLTLDCLTVLVFGAIASNKFTDGDSKKWQQRDPVPYTITF